MEKAKDSLPTTGDPVPSQGTINPVDETGGSASDEKKAKKGCDFWFTFSSLVLTAFLSALEGSVVSTALPTIARALEASENYVWVVNVYYLSNAAFQPIYGQLADLWGRRWLTIGAVVIFTVGSGICGGATSIDMLIGGRAIQGLGSAGINMLVELILCDLLPLRERGQFFGIIFMFVILGSVIGPFLGGILVDRVSWRWVFYINIPFSGVCVVLLFFFLHIKNAGTGNFIDKVKRIDFFGNFLLAASVGSCLFALTYGDTRYPFSDTRIIVSLVLGLLGHVAFMFFEASPWCKEPVMPMVLFKNRTSAGAYIATFLQTLVSFWVLYFLPLYFQSTQLVSATRSGVMLLPFSVVYALSSLAGGALTTKLGRFRNIHFASFALMTIGMGTLTILNRSTSLAVIVVLEMIVALAIGVPTANLLTAIQAALPDELNALSTGTFAFLRSVGTIWGVSIPAAIFNNRFDQLLPELSDPTAVRALQRGGAYQQATSEFVDSFPSDVRDVIISIYERSLERVWQIGIVFAGVGFLVIFLERDLKLGTQKKTEDIEINDIPQTAADNSASRSNTINDTASQAPILKQRRSTNQERETV
ncbi:hypothetical protein MCOR25_008792 [Pyricularia grisea]|nr:hypothetical protein MCOR25_008792 [Pyricularia grisea]